MNRNFIRKLFSLCLLIMALTAVSVSDASEEFVTLKKFLSARMYGEAYNELLKQELLKDDFDPRLEKLRKDLLDRTAERLNRQARINPDDPTLFVILADISFHKGNLDQASSHISKALSFRAGPMANYVFAKILFRKGNLSQAFDQMGTVLENMPDSPVVFDDFQFLYACKSYGIATARKISKNTNFIKRATPVAGDSNLPKLADSPFENDPTDVANIIPGSKNPAPADDPDFPEQNDSIDNAQIAANHDPLPDEIDNHSSGLDDDDDFSEDDLNNDEGASGTEQIPPRPLPAGKDITVAVAQTRPDQDPETEKIKKAEYWLEQARRQFKNRNYDDADQNLKKATDLYTLLPGKEELRSQIDEKFTLLKSYRKSKELYENEKFEEALPGLEAAYRQEPDKTRDAPLMIGKIYLLRAKPDYDNALKYFDIVTKDKDVEPLLKRDIQWTKLEIFFDTGRYEEANEIFQDFLANEEAFTKGQVNFRQLRYGLWYHLNKLYIHIGLGIFALMFIIVFALQLLPALSFSFADALTSAKRSYQAGKFEKTVTIAEKALFKKQPVQIERELRELVVKAQFELKNYVRCQESARIILEKFPGNQVAWGHLAKASMASHDTSNEAITMYEAIYKENPGKTEFLPVLARHYATTRNYTVEAMGILFTYYQASNHEPPIVIALADGYVQSRAMGNEVITILEETLKLKDKLEYRELLARNYSKAGRYSDAARECTKVLNENINNMGIHVVYTSSMKKLKMIEEAIGQYKEFLQRYPGNEQLLEILAGLKKDASDLSSIDNDGLPSIPDELPMPDLPEPDLPGSVLSPEDIDIENFIEPPPDGFEEESQASVPVPDFLKQTYDVPAPAPAKKSSPVHAPAELPTLDPFEESDSLLDEFADDLPEELGGPTTTDFSESIDMFASKNAISQDDLLPSSNSFPSVKQSSHSSGVEMQQKLSSAREKAQKKCWNEVIDILSPVFASDRNRDVGLLLADAWLQKGNAINAVEIIETLDFDLELMSDSIKDILYRTGLALEKAKRLDDALKMFDMICNVDINFRDAFERSDKIYARKS